MDEAHDRPETVRDAVFNRRTLIIGAAGVFAVGCSGSDGTSSGSEPTPSSTSTTTEPSAVSVSGESILEPLTPELFGALPICALTPAQAAGPFPSLELLDRRDVTEGYPGQPLRLGIRVVDVACEPLPGARVEIWHTDASGDYSAYEDGGIGKDEGAGTTFLRGVQTADDDGIVEFLTIYPGWYTGRAVHIHTRVLMNDRNVLTTQLYFDEEYTRGVYATAGYREFGLPDTTWATDGLIGDPPSDGTGITLAPGPTASGDGTLGLVNLGVPA